MARYKLELKQLDYVSLVDDPAQPNAKCLLIKRAGKVDEISATARLVKTSDELGLAFFWAFTSTNADGTEHYDLHGDQVMSDNAMIKAAAEFMEKGGAVDEMHDYEQTGRVVFAMPMTPEIAKAYGVETKTSGLMVALRPSAEAMAKLKDGTYKAVSIAGLGEREEVTKGKSARVQKATLYTDEVDGHQHEICVWEDGGFYVRSATSTDATYSHSHGIVFENGALVILADSGHTHELAAGQPGVAVVPADAIVIVQARAPSVEEIAMRERAAKSRPLLLASKSTRSESVRHGGFTTEPTMSQAPDLSKQLADLTKSHERLERVAKMSGAHKAHFDTLTGDDAESFLAKSTADREAIVQKSLEDDKPIWTGEVTKVAVRKRDGLLALELAKQNEANADKLAKREAEFEKADIRKRAIETIGKLAGGDAVHDLIVRSVMKSGAPQADIDAALTAMKGWNAIAATKSVAPGTGGTDAVIAADRKDAFGLLTKGLETFAKAKSIDQSKLWTDGLDAFVQTDEGAALKRAYDEAQ